jgi:uncharacterized protein (TIGR00299 family) protein
MRLAYFDCFSGISGDMTLGALLDLGFRESTLREGLAALPVGGYRIEIARKERGGLEGTSVRVIVEEEKQPHRHYTDIKKILSESDLSDRSRSLASEIFECIARAEAHVHGKSVDKVHFHEVGAVDSIVDIVGVALGIEALDIGATCVSSLPLGGGFVKCSHGVLPVPAPATVEIVKGMRVKEHPVQAELVTPTGAAIASVLAGPGHPPLRPTRFHKVGYGVGNKEFDHPNLLRIFLGDSPEGYEQDEVEVIECQIDDLQPELYPYLTEKLLQSGAIDVYLIPVQMKKGRTGFLVQVLAEPSEGLRVSEVLFRETTTLGVRLSHRNRIKLSRRACEVETRLGRMPAKRVEGPCLDGAELRPEYEACRRVAEEKGIPLRKVYDEVIRAGRTVAGEGGEKKTRAKKGKRSKDG